MIDRHYEHLKAPLPAVCEKTFVPTVDPALPASFYFWSLTGAPFNASVYTPYVKSILAGLKLPSYFEYSA